MVGGADGEKGPREGDRAKERVKVIQGQDESLIRNVSPSVHTSF